MIHNITVIGGGSTGYAAAAFLRQRAFLSRCAMMNALRRFLRM